CPLDRPSASAQEPPGGRGRAPEPAPPPSSVAAGPPAQRTPATRSRVLAPPPTNPGQSRLELFAPTFALLPSSTQSRLGADHGADERDQPGYRSRADGDDGLDHVAVIQASAHCRPRC